MNHFQINNEMIVIVIFFFSGNFQALSFEVNSKNAADNLKRQILAEFSDFSPQVSILEMLIETSNHKLGNNYFLL